MLELGNSAKFSHFLNDQALYPTKNKQSFSSDAKILLEPRLKQIEGFVAIIPQLQQQVRNQEKAISQLMTDNELFRKIQQRLLDEIFDLKTKMNSLVFDDQQQYKQYNVFENRMNELRSELSLMMKQFKKQFQEDILEKISIDLKDSSSPCDKRFGLANQSCQSTTFQRCKSQDKINTSQVSPQYHSTSQKMNDIQLVKSLEIFDSPTITKVKTMANPTKEKLGFKHEWTKQSTKHLQTKSELIKDIYLQFQNSQTKFIVQSPRKDVNDSIDMIKEFFTVKNKSEANLQLACTQNKRSLQPQCLLKKNEQIISESAHYDQRISYQSAKQDPYEQLCNLNESLM